MAGTAARSRRPRAGRLIGVRAATRRRRRVPRTGARRTWHAASRLGASVIRRASAMPSPAQLRRSEAKGRGGATSARAGRRGTEANIRNTAPIRPARGRSRAGPQRPRRRRPPPGTEPVRRRPRPRGPLERGPVPGRRRRTLDPRPGAASLPGEAHALRARGVRRGRLGAGGVDRHEPAQRTSPRSSRGEARSTSAPVWPRSVTTWTSISCAPGKTSKKGKSIAVSAEGSSQSSA